MSHLSRMVAAALAVLLLWGPALADNKAVADALFDEGVKFREAGNFADACAKFAASQELDPGAGTLLNLGDCSERQEKYATAWSYYNEAASFATQQGARAKAQLAEQRRDAVAPRLSRITVEVSENSHVEQLHVELSGAPVSAATYGTALPFDGGKHELVASAPGYETWRKAVELGAEKDSVTITIPPLKKSAAPPAEESVEPEAETTTTTSVTADQPPEDGSSQALVGYIVGGAGLALAGVSLAVGITVFDDVSTMENDEALCGADKQCTPAGEKLREQANTKALFATIAVPTGLAAAAVGVYLVLTAGPAEEPGPAATAGLQPLLGPGVVGLGYSGEF